MYCVLPFVLCVCAFVVTLNKYDFGLEGMDIAYAVLIFVYGAIIGSFLNVCIYRVPRRESLSGTRSHCPHCDSKIRFYDNIPILSYFILRGRCRTCGRSISARYLAVESVSAVVGIGIYRAYGIGPDFFAYSLLSALLIVLASIDWEHRIVPNRLTLPGIVVGLGLSPFIDTVTFRESAVGLVLGGGTLLCVGLIGGLLFRKESMGGGDIKLAAMVGTFVGWKLVLASLFLAFALGAIAGLASLVVASRRDRTIPFAPFIAGGTVCALLWGDALIGIYLRV